MSAAQAQLIGGIEAGGTKFVLAIGRSPTEIIARTVIPTRQPDETLAEAAAWFEAQPPIVALGIASFGPVQLDQTRDNWGYITDTPKSGWSNCDVAGYFAKRLQVPIGFDTDVNAAALAEFQLGAGRGATSLAYVTVGTGIGGGFVMDSHSMRGAAHPEVGHIYPRRAEGDATFAGICPHHGDCLEGLASGPAIMARWGKSLSQLPEEHPAHTIIADYIAQLCHAIFAMTSAEVIVLGGGVMQTGGLLERVSSRTNLLGANYLPGRELHRVVSPGVKGSSGEAGAMLLAALKLLG